MPSPNMNDRARSSSVTRPALKILKFLSCRQHSPQHQSSSTTRSKRGFLTKWYVMINVKSPCVLAEPNVAMRQQWWSKRSEWSWQNHSHSQFAECKILRDNDGVKIIKKKRVITFHILKRNKIDWRCENLD
jgi:hypothetical protein